MGKTFYRFGSGIAPAPDPDPRRIRLNENQCERMTRPEMSAIRALLPLVSYCHHGKRDLEKRLKNGQIPHGWWRYCQALGAIDAIVTDIMGTTTQAQARQIWNTMQDMDVQIVPKTLPVGQTVVMDMQTAKDLVDCAQEKCKVCTEDGESCKKCKLYQVLEATTPLDDYECGMLCPYSLAKWEE